ncbi:MAG: sugar isomerase [Candidatus Giovannonibacteria bacterium GW2011_GWC2_44_9]|uniref:Sugar isomerase n=3 Tax=Candidatus Giovannoniibacteriota TaxID=1752738 RepID=A0A0G1IZ94_9BACT|nr:MAG: sugar isomerase [Candidatus Giovannonibacteria bacterium GW2011_GWB1_44_23]KKT64333.1 MAG: sugar isomerase [Candidatus Giovannonibacteria bacterium GW2011_GWA1_44_29]KKT84287.1 MAG: sugar isomerase [Candidatus Giovannonibacteria bacterium GW2011_GWC2_44_9]KKT92060.1 MAG: sugar isomerase [Parcubacteria group bacterium GW2011_GWC1_45_13]
MSKDHIAVYLNEVAEIAGKIDQGSIHKTIEILRDVREKKGRLFILGVGGSAANASHAVNDFRKIAHIQSYSPTDNVAELTARVNDDGWDSVFVGWLKHNHVTPSDAVLVLSVGGGNAEKNVSANIVHALNHAKEVGAKIVGIVSRDGGYTAKMADACVLVPVVNQENVTAHAEAWQAVIWHAIVFHPELKMTEGKWESVQKPILS